MKFKKLVVGTIAVAATLTGTGVAMAAINTSYPEGGIWNYGVENGRVKSDYYHHTSCHSASVHGVYWNKSGDVAATFWAKSDTIAAGAGNEAFYDMYNQTRC